MMTTELENRPFLAALPGLAHLAAGQLDKLAGLFRETVVPARRTLFQEGDPTPGLHVVKSGWVKIVRTSTRGRELLMSLCGPGDTFGPCCHAFEPAETPCQARTQSAARLLIMSSQNWRALGSTDPGLAHAVLRTLLASRRSCTDLAAMLAFQSVEARLARLLGTLTRWTDRQGPRDAVVPRILSQSEMACAIGTSREVVTRLLQKFKQRGLVRRRGRQIVIVDRRTLARLAE